MKKIRWWLYYTFLFGSLLPVASISTLVCILTKNYTFIFKQAERFLRIACVITGVKLKVHNKEVIEAGKGYLFVANHQSFLDISIILTSVNYLSFFAKIELLRWPFFGFAMKNNHGIFLDRKKPKDIRFIKDTLKEKINQGISYCVFPEGTRGLNGKLLPFKKGILKFAYDAKVPIIPITIVNAWTILPKKPNIMNKGTVDCYIHPPVQPETLSFDELVTTLQTTISSKLKTSTNDSKQ